MVIDRNYMTKNNQITALDLGSSKICAIVAEMEEEQQQPRVLGFGLAASEGIRRGSIVDVEKATAAINRAVSRAEEQSGRSVNTCYVGITGDHIRGMNTVGRISLIRDARNGAGEIREVESADVSQVLEHTRSIPLPPDRDILHVIPQEYIVDQQSGVKNPCHLAGRRLEARVHLTTYNTTIVSNITRCLKNINLDVEKLILQSLAAAYSTVQNDEKELGTVLLDFGAETVDIAVFFRGSIYHTGVVQLGGASVTNDLAYLLRIPIEQAEKLKIEHGFASPTQVDKTAEFQLREYGGSSRTVPYTLIAEYIEPRLEEIFEAAIHEARKADLPINQKPGLVLTGGGVLQAGLQQYIEKRFKTSVRIGQPTGFSGCDEELNSPIYSAALGLLQFAIHENQSTEQNTKVKGFLARPIGWMKNLIENVM